MKSIKVLVIVAVASCMAAPSAFALVGVSAVGGITHTTPSVSGGGVAMSTTPRPSYLFGALADVGLSPETSLEGGVLYTHARYSGSANGITYTVGASGIQIPILARFHPLPYLSLGAGGYYAYRVGDADLEEISVPGPGVTMSSGNSKSDFGVVGSVRSHYPVGAATSVFLDVRYLHGLKNLDSSGGEYKMRQTQVFAGLRFGI